MYVAEKNGKVFHITEDQVKVWERSGYKVEKLTEAPAKPKRKGKERKDDSGAEGKGV